MVRIDGDVLNILNKRMTEQINDKDVYRTAPASPGLLNIYIYWRNQSGCEKAKKVGFLPSLL